MKPNSRAIAGRRPRGRRPGRALIGLIVAVMATAIVGHPATADPKPTAPARAAQAGDAVLAGFADWTEVYAFQARLNAAAEQILAAGGAGNASIVADPGNHELRVHWHGPLPAKVRTLAAGLDVPVAFRPAAFPHRELVAQAQRLADDPRVADAAPEADGSGVAVTVTTPLDQVGLQASTAVPLEVTVGTRLQSMVGRQADTASFWGGSRYFSTEGSCSNGIPVKINNVFHMLSAAHCGQDGAAANIPGQPAPTGTMFGKSTCRDTVLISYPAGVGQRIYTGSPTSFSSAQIVGAARDFVGNRVVTGGASSGEHLNIPVRAVDLFTTVGGIPCGNAVGPLTLASYDQLTCAVAPGDSGGPVYSYLGDKVLARGTITGGNTDTTCPGSSPAGGSRVVYAPLLRPPGNTIGSLRFYGAEAPATTIFDLNGAWTDGLSARPVITVLDRAITVNMSALGRPNARGTVVDASNITVTFPDDATYTARLIAPGTILWSNNSTWTKLP